MATIGVMPTATTVQLRDPDGDTGTVPAATPRAAGCMTASHVQRIEALEKAVFPASASATNVVSLRAPAAASLAPAAPAPVAAPDPRVDDLQEAVAILTDRVAALPDASVAQPASVVPPGLLDRIGLIERDLKRAMSPVPMMTVNQRLDAIERHMAEPAEAPDMSEVTARLAALEARLAEPVGLDDDVPAFARRFSPAPDPEPIGPTVHQHIANAAVLARLDAIERKLSEMDAREPESLPAPANLGPPVRVVGVAHLARNGQALAVSLMERMGQVMGCDWQEAAARIIREDDLAAEAEVELYARAIERDRNATVDT